MGYYVAVVIVVYLRIFIEGKVRDGGGWGDDGGVELEDF